MLLQREQAEQDNGAGQPGRAEAAQLPPSLRRRYRVYFKPETKRDVLKLREVRADQIGKFVTVKAGPTPPPCLCPRCLFVAPGLTAAHQLQRASSRASATSSRSWRLPATLATSAASKSTRRAPSPASPRRPAAATTPSRCAQPVLAPSSTRVRSVDPLAGGDRRQFHASANLPDVRHAHQRLCAAPLTDARLQGAPAAVPLARLRRSLVTWQHPGAWQRPMQRPIFLRCIWEPHGRAAGASCCSLCAGTLRCPGSGPSEQQLVANSALHAPLPPINELFFKPKRSIGGRSSSSSRRSSSKRCRRTCPSATSRAP